MKGRPRTQNFAHASEADGFTLVEIMMVALVISVLASLALPAVKRVQLRAKTSAIVNDFRVFAAAFDTYAHETGGWPAETAPGVLPAMMAGRITPAMFTRATPMGGKYNWENNKLHRGVHYTAALSIKGTVAAPLPLDLEQLLDIDRPIDDGDLTTGNFIAGTNNVPLFVIQR
jgi:prepilin-type N-terminal cleavage/methylation domain-containing protein